MSKEEWRETRPWGWIEGWLQDFQNAFKSLRRSPAFAGVVVCLLALGIGATAALFAVVDTALLRPLPGLQPNRLLWLEEYSRNHQSSGGTPLRFHDWQTAKSFSSMCAVYSDRGIYTGAMRPVQLRILHTLGDPYKTLGQSLLMGRPFSAAENRGEGQAVAILTSAAWHRYLGTDPNILSRNLRVGTTNYQVVGILDSDATGGIDFPEGVDMWAPMSLEIARAPRQSGFLAQMARLAPGATLEQARAELSLIAGNLSEAYPATDGGRTINAILLQDHITSEARTPLLTLLAAVGAVLLIACVNICGLMLARGLSRQREAAIRISVGAGFFRLARLLFAESIILAALGCGLGLIVAETAIGVLKAVLPPDIPHLAAVGLGWRVVAWSLALAALSAVLFGTIPAWQFACSSQWSALRAGGKGTTDSGSKRLRSLLVVVEVALSLILLVSASLLANSFLRLRAQNAGFNSANAYSFGIPFGWDTDARVLNSFADGALLRLTTSPGVIAAGVVDELPLHGGSQSGTLLVEGMELSEPIADTKFSWRTASSGYFVAAGIPVSRGALYKDWLAGKGEKQAVITDTLSEKLFPNGDAVGHLVALASQSKKRAPDWFRIVGVVGSVRLNASYSTTEAGVYVPWGATYWPEMKFVVRSNRSLSDFARLVRDHVQPLTNQQLAENVNTLEALTAETRSSERVRTIMLVSFAGAALLLSAVGLFGTLSHELARHRQDYGVRLALGADPRLVAWMAVKSALALAVAGIFIGAAACLWTSQLIQGLLFGIEPYDPFAYLLAALVLLITAVAAAAIPAVRAARIDPIQALRHE